MRIVKTANRAVLIRQVNVQVPIAIVLLILTGCASDLPLIGSKFASSDTLPESTELRPEEPSDSSPVTVAAKLVHRVNAGTLQANVELRIAPGYFLHHFDVNNPGNVPVTVSMDLQNMLGENVEWRYSDSSLEHGAQVFRDRVSITGVVSVPGEKELPKYAKLTVRYQACSETTCLEPSRIELAAEITRDENS